MWVVNNDKVTRCACFVIFFFFFYLVAKTTFDEKPSSVIAVFAMFFILLWGSGTETQRLEKGYEVVIACSGLDLGLVVLVTLLRLGLWNVENIVPRSITKLWQIFDVSYWLGSFEGFPELCICTEKEVHQGSLDSADICLIPFFVFCREFWGKHIRREVSRWYTLVILV